MNTRTLARAIWRLLMAYGMVPLTGTSCLLGVTPEEVEKIVLEMKRSMGRAGIDLHDGFIILKGR